MIIVSLLNNDELGEECSTYERDFSRELEGKSHLKDLVIDGRTVLKLVSTK
jgi:hypothetical protein